MQETVDHTKGLWIMGQSGCGKSSTARKLYPDAYIKNVNKWFDGYQGEKAIIMDDLDDGHSGMAQLLKIWTDHYGCRFETKGGSVPSNHAVFVVTSQYSIEEIFGEGTKASEALLRRFEVKTVKDGKLVFPEL